LLLDAAESSDQRHFRKTTTQTQGLGRKAVANTLDTFSVRQTGTTLSAGHIDLTAGNDLTLIATAVAATGDIRFTAGAEIAYLAATQLDEFHATRKTSDNLLGFANLSGLIDNGWQQAKAKRETTSTTRTGAVTVIQTPDAVLSQSAGDTTLAGTTIRAGRFTATAGLGANGEGGQANAQIHLLGIKESETFSQTKESGSFMWQSAKGEGSSTETLRLPDIQAYGASTAAPAIGPQGPVGDVPETERASELASLSPTLTAPGGITVGATDLTTTQAEANRATPGHAGNGTPPPTVKLDLKTQAETLAQQPGLAWLGELAQRDDVDWQQIALIHDQWDYKQSGLTQEGGAVIAIVVAIVTWGWGSSAATTSTAIGSTGTTATTVGGMTLSTTTATGITYSALGTALNAGFTTLATQASVSLINNKGDIGQTLKDLGSSDSVKQLLTSMLTAGALNAVGGTDWMKQFNGTTITDRLVTQMVNSAVSATVQTAVMGGSYEDTLSTMLLTGGVNATAGWAAGEIGAWYADANTDIAGKYLAHKVA
ncbi:hypothetical protein GO613_23080, partial [Azoarcus communis]|uniref:DUF637 domain-containing protein n=1 Tax=Parazoarcus communis TaxID=41977 RepID=UPI001459E9C7